MVPIPSPPTSRAPALTLILTFTLAWVLVSSPTWSDSPTMHSSHEPGAGWSSLFRSQLDARLSSSFKEDLELDRRIARVWDALVGNHAAREEAQGFDPMQQYPVLGFVDDQFYVMKYRAPGGRESFVVRAEAEALNEVPTLGSTLREFLEGVYEALGEIAQEQVSRMTTGEGYNPDFDQLMEHNPFQHGRLIQVPDMGSFKNRLLRFTGIGGRLGAHETESYERMKRQMEAGQSLQVGRAHRWGVAVETAELVREGRTLGHYRTIREVAAVRDRFVGEGRVGALLREPRLGSVIEVSACVEACNQRQSWRRIYPDRDEVSEGRPNRRARGPSSADPMSPDLERASQRPRDRSPL